jgi:hypothetical protein
MGIISFREVSTFGREVTSMLVLMPIPKQKVVVSFLAGIVIRLPSADNPMLGKEDDCLYLEKECQIGLRLLNLLNTLRRAKKDNSKSVLRCATKNRNFAEEQILMVVIISNHYIQFLHPTHI